MSLVRRTLLAALAALPFAPAVARAQAGPPRVRMETRLGTIVVEVFPDKAPLTAGLFLRMVGEHRYVKPAFYRVLRAPGAETTGLIQGGETVGSTRTLKPIAHESTIQTGLTHLDGVLSMPRDRLGSARGEFFICIGDQTYLDAKPPVEGQDLAGFAAFGRVVEGMDVARAIHALEPSPTKGPEGMRGQMLDPALTLKLERV